MFGSVDGRRTGGVGARSAIIGLGAGTGIGSTYADTRREFEKMAGELSSTRPEKK
jgi:hypothetical protein